MQQTVEIMESIFSENNEFDSVYLIGCGGSLAKNWHSKYFLETNAKKLVVGYYTSNEFVHATPKRVGKNSIVISSSHEGETAESAEALRVASDLGAVTIAITINNDSTLAKNADYIVNYEWNEERDSFKDSSKPSDTHEVVILKLALEALNRIEGYEHYDDFVKGLDIYNTISRDARETFKPQAEEMANKYKNDTLIYTLASGPSHGVAYTETSCIFMEMQWIDSAVIHSGEYFHGPFEITKRENAFILLKGIGHTRPLDQRVHDFLIKKNDHFSVIDNKDFNMEALPETVRPYFDGLMHNYVIDVFSRRLAEVREHPLSKRRYMWKEEY